MNENLKFLKSSPGISGRWRKVKIKVVNPDNYVLYETWIRVRLEIADKGFRIFFQNPVLIPAEKLMGPRIREASVYDVKFCFTEITLSAKSMGMKDVPRVVKEGDVVRVGC